MKPTILISLLLLLTSCSSLTIKSLESFIKNDRKSGFTLVSIQPTPGTSSSNKSYIINYQNPALKNSWGLVVATSGDKSKNELDQVSIGTTVLSLFLEKQLADAYLEKKN